MLPYPDNAPPSFSQALAYELISFDISVELGSPVCRVSSWCIAMVGASMPETSIHEHSDALAREDDIGTDAYVCKLDW